MCDHHDRNDRLNRIGEVAQERAELRQQFPLIGEDTINAMAEFNVSVARGEAVLLEPVVTDFAFRSPVVRMDAREAQA